MIQRICNKGLALSLYCTLALGLLVQCRVNGNEHLMNVNYRGVILEGYDSVAFFTKGRPVKGDPRFQSRHKDAVFYFTSEKNRQLFQARPEKYSPQFGGWCAYAVSQGHVSPVDIEFFKIQNGRLILQHNQKAWDLYEKAPRENLAKADQNWPDLLLKHRKGRYVAF